MTLIHQSHLSVHSNQRPAWAVVDTVVIHSMSACLGKDPHSIENCIATLESAEVSCHYLIGRDGSCWRFVQEGERAWHAGESCLETDEGSRPGVNDFSIGIELICHEQEQVNDAQYKALSELIKDILRRHPIRYVCGHDDIAIPAGRKTDPGATFDWSRFQEELKVQEVSLANLKLSKHCTVSSSDSRRG